jgi:hypothetical protein
MKFSLSIGQPQAVKAGNTYTHTNTHTYTYIHTYIHVGGVSLSWKMIKMESPAAVLKKMEIPTDSGLSIVIDFAFNKDVCAVSYIHPYILDVSLVLRLCLAVKKSKWRKGRKLLSIFGSS